MRIKKRYLILIIALVMLVNVGCGNQQIDDAESSSNEEAPEDETNENKLEEENNDMNEEKETIESKENNILIAYFTWAENTVVENPETVDVDASTSASVLPPGNAGKMANWIQEITEGEIFKIVNTEMYPSDYDMCLDVAAEEKANDYRPELLTEVENMEKYDVIFLGYPNWWYTAPMAIFSFIESYDLSGKTIILFVTHGTGGLASSVVDVEEALPDSSFLEPIGVYRPEVDDSEDYVKDWVESLDY